MTVCVRIGARGRRSLAALSVFAFAFSAATAAWAGQAVPQVDGLVLVDPPDDRAAKRLDGAPWIAPVWDRAPVAVGGPQAPGDDGGGTATGAAADQQGTQSNTRVTLQSSLAQWSTYAQKQTMERLAAAQATATKPLPLPQTTRPDPALDAWMKVETAQGAPANPFIMR